MPARTLFLKKLTFHEALLPSTSSKTKMFKLIYDNDNPEKLFITPTITCLKGKNVSNNLPGKIS